MFLKMLGLPQDTVKASRRTVLNGKKLEWDTKHQEVGRGHYKLGMEVEKQPQGWLWTTWTVENETHVVNFWCIITDNAKLVEGTINIFALGKMPLDQGYVDQLLEEVEESSFKWDEFE